MKLYKNWFLASRPWSFSMTAISVSVGTVLGALEGDLSWTLYFLTLFGMVVLHAATNLMNDYYDVRGGVDYEEVSTAQYRPHPILGMKLDPLQVRNGALLLYGVATVIGLYLAVLRGWELLLVGAIGVFASLTYTAPPFKYKYKALGEFSVFLMWGPFMVTGAYFVQRQSFSASAALISLPFGMLVALVLLANNIRDIPHDRSKGILTLPILLGQRNGLHLYFAIVLLAYFSIFLMSVLGPLSPWSLLIFLSLPLAFQLLRKMVREIPINADALTARLNTTFGILILLSLVLEAAF
ncbi:MAG: 1,4-dihydroxy-2-naphthoate octaprenyltransferase [Deltaproteobacteria bacterium]|nr:1,4-dihydroxy-2-naphthoate octaprenyltransferase [Deltaproteobacteria bacterium]